MRETLEEGLVSAAAVDGRLPAALVIAIATAACTGPPSEPQAPEAADERPPSVLLVVLDTVRADHLSVEGYGRNTSPQLEKAKV